MKRCLDGNSSSVSPPKVLKASQAKEDPPPHPPHPPTSGLARLLDAGGASAPAPALASAARHVLALLSPDDLGALGQTSRRNNAAVLGWVLRDDASRRALLPCLLRSAEGGDLVFSDRPDEPFSLGEESAWRRDFSALGRTLKKLTCIRPTRERLEIAWDFLGQLKAKRPEGQVLNLPSTQGLVSSSSLT